MATYSASGVHESDEKFPNTESFTVKFLNTKAELEKKKKIYNTVNVSALPDKGGKLKNQIRELEAALESLSIEAAKNENKDDVTSDVKSVQTNKDDYRKKMDETKHNSDTESVQKNKDDYRKKVDETKHKATVDCSVEKPSAPFSSATNLLSFRDLSEAAVKEESSVIATDLLSSPSFSVWQGQKKSYGMKLIDARPLHPPNNVKKYSKSSFYSKVYTDIANEETFKKLQESLETYPEDERECDAESLKTTLMTHQRKALAWLMWREMQSPSGGILADDMGLGKTLTMISLVLKKKELNIFSAPKSENSTCRGTLVVCTASLIHQWQEEIKNHCGSSKLSILMYHGPKRERSLNEIRKYDMVLTTYEILMVDKRADGIEAPMFKLKWERIILDEAHYIKSYNSKRADAVFSLQSFQKWCVTGTPIHNEFKDIYSLLKFLQFSPFNDYKKFKKLLIDEKDFSEHRRNLLMKSILLRRTKQDTDSHGNPLVKMTKRTEYIIGVELSHDERNLYREIEKKANEKVNKFFARKLNSKTSLNYSNLLLVWLLRLQQCCNHASLLGKEVEEILPDSSDLSISFASLSLENNSSKSCTDATDSNLNFSFSDCKSSKLNNEAVKSTKVQKLFEELKRISDNSEDQDKSIIVSQWVSMLKIIEFHLQEENLAYHLICGSTKPIDRQKIIDDFNNKKGGPKILLLSLKAGGIGLNLTGANHLFLTDLHWNPALEVQVCDRIWRISQTKNVFIYKFICKKTIEERIKALQDSKLNLACSVLYGARKCASGITQEEFKYLFNINT